MLAGRNGMVGNADTSDRPLCGYDGTLSFTGSGDLGLTCCVYAA